MRKISVPVLINSKELKVGEHLFRVEKEKAQPAATPSPIKRPEAPEASTPRPPKAPRMSSDSGQPVQKGRGAGRGRGRGRR